MLLSASLFSAAEAQTLLTEKRTFEMPSFTTQSGRMLKAVKVGWESHGTLNADKSNAILICHFFSGSSHAAGKYKESDAAPGYWDAIIGPGKAIDTNKYFVLSSDTLVNLGANDPGVVTTGPASINPDTGKPYGMDFPIVTIADFVEVQKKLADSLGIKQFQLVAGASMGGLQTFEWAARYPQMVSRAMPVISFGEADANLIAWLDIWAMPIRLDPNWNNGDYYGKAPPNAGFAQSLKIVTLHAQHWDWANKTFGRKWAKEGENPAAGFDKRFLIEQTLDNAGAGRAKTSDANHFLYLVKANQLFVAGGAGSLEEGMKKIKAPVLLIHSPKDLVFPPGGVDETAARLKANGVAVEQIQLKGDRGHLDGVLSIKQAEESVRAFFGQVAPDMYFLPSSSGQVKRASSIWPARGSGDSPAFNHHGEPSTPCSRARGFARLPRLASRPGRGQGWRRASGFGPGLLADRGRRAVSRCRLSRGGRGGFHALHLGRAGADGLLRGRGLGHGDAHCRPGGFPVLGALHSDVHDAVASVAPAGRRGRAGDPGVAAAAAGALHRGHGLGGGHAAVAGHGARGAHPVLSRLFEYDHSRGGNGHRGRLFPDRTIAATARGGAAFHRAGLFHVVSGQ